jgi:signal transduction histidine kinase
MPQNSQLDELKRQLEEEVKKEQPNSSILLKLSDDISKLDTNQVRFSVDAGIINRLGKELVGRHETAVSELVKNAYDADATEVNLTFENAWQPGGTLYIKDDGQGMTRDQLINGFMRLSSSQKIHNPMSEKYNRIRAGKKGIGRFATQRLGNKLTIITQTLEAANAIKISINWDDFETDKDLLSITNQVEQVAKTKEEGTDLIIEGLREGWSDATIKRVFRYTSELLQPFPLSKKKKDEKKNRIDPGFKSEYFRKDGDNTTPIINEEDAILKHALAEIEGYIQEDGQGRWSLKSEALGFKKQTFSIGKDREQDNTKFIYNKNVHFKCYYFIYEATYLPGQLRTFIQEIAKEKGGIRLYRNGFRVLPYGEPGNDWTRLDASVRRNVILTPHANNSFFGFVEITDNEGKIYEETSSREGLIENEAFDELVDFVYRAIISATIKVAELRGRKGTASQKEWKKKETEEITEQVDSAISDLGEFIENESSEEEQSSDSKSGKYKEALDRLKEGREREKVFNEEERTRLLNEIDMLRILAGLGIVIGEFVHEVKRFLPAFDVDILYLKEIVKNNPEALLRAERLDSNLKSFTAYTSYFDKAISQNVLRDLVPIDLVDVVNDFEAVIENDIRRANIIFSKPIFEGFDLITRPMHPSEWASILFNFYTNAKKAIRRKKVQGNIFIRCGLEDAKVFLEFSDNGDGIPKENEELVFNAFFTTTSAAGYSSNQNESLTGTGLGLKIVRDIVEGYGGAIYVTTPPNNFSTTIRIEIPINKQDND